MVDKPSRVYHQLNIINHHIETISVINHNCIVTKDTRFWWNSVKAFCENQLVKWNLQERVMYILLLFVNCSLLIFLFSKAHSKLKCREGNGTPLQYSCLENPMDGGAWWAAAHGVSRSRTRLSDVTFTFHFPALQKEMATHSSFLDWRIPGMEEPGGLPSMGSHRVGHDWSDLAAAAANLYAWKW